jgi:hypothetical protein
VYVRHFTILRSLTFILPLFILSRGLLDIVNSPRAENPITSVIAISAPTPAARGTALAKISDDQLRKLSGDTNLTFKLSVLGENLGDKIGDTNNLFTV